jgi:predicted metal-dependent phosphotriesterase family hydrolase
MIWTDDIIEFKGKYYNIPASKIDPKPIQKPHQSSSSKNDKNRFPLSRTIDQIESDIQRIKAMGVDHIVFGYNFVPMGRDVAKMIDVSKELSKFAR